MALTAAASPFFSTPSLRNHRRNIKFRKRRMRIMASDDSPSEMSTKRKHVDTRIHWSNQEEGWIGGDKKSQSPSETAAKKEPLGARFAQLINESTTSHYQFLGVMAAADMEEIKSAYRRLSKEYHPDTTSLPLKTASEKFMQLREAYNVLSNEDSRKFYDWTLVQEAESRRAAQMKMKLEDPYQQDVRNAEPMPDMVDRLGGRNMDLSDQAISALTFDIAVVIFCICCIVYIVFFKEPY
uniref:Chaperone DnaJ-domain superfamily protein n=1 Tax=Cypripedium formosanum TaxID=53042 RepID=A0A0F7H1F9_9ASPA